MRIPELLAPVGSMEHLKVAINAGASSVYLSGKNYGARKFAENFTLDEIGEAVNIAHMHNVKVYITVNTLIKEDELESVVDYLSKLYAIGVDAVYYHPDAPNVQWNEEGQPFGYNGVGELFRQMDNAMKETEGGRI